MGYILPTVHSLNNMYHERIYTPKASLKLRVERLSKSHRNEAFMQSLQEIRRRYKYDPEYFGKWIDMKV